MTGIEILLIDLDGTVYPINNGIWAAISTRMDLYMKEKLGLPESKIPEIRGAYYKEYGTTLRGIQDNHQIDPEEYLAFVHDIPLQEYLEFDDELRNALISLPQPKYIFTNADREHTKRVLTMVGIDDLFTDIFDVLWMGYNNKPQEIVYHKAMEAIGNPDPRSYLFADDTLLNLQPAQNIGMRTILVGNTITSNNSMPRIPRLAELPNVIQRLVE